MTTQTVSREMITDCIDDARADGSIALRLSYSGRAMYGERCFGFTGSESALMSVFIEIAIKDSDLARKLSRHMRSDSMGRDTIFYFPGFELDDPKDHDQPDLYGLVEENDGLMTW